MNKEDFERLKAVCEKEGFELLKSLPDKDINFHILAVSKKDIWDGVEFAECVAFADIHGKTNGFLTFGKIYRVSNIVSGSTDCHIINDWGYEGNCMLNLLKPSTESAYIEQLKKEAHERFGEIRNGDIFKQPWFHSPVTIQGENKGFTYESFQDSLFFNGWAIYHSGKWATKVKERVEVEPISGQFFQIDNTVQFKFKTINMNGLKGNIIEFLASQLEKYLNGEVE